MEEIFADIDRKCPSYVPFRTFHGLVLMCNCSEVPFLLYDMVTRIFFPIDIDNSSNDQMSQFWYPTQEECNDLIKYGDVFAIAARMDSIDEIPPLDMVMGY